MSGGTATAGAGVGPASGGHGASRRALGVQHPRGAARPPRGVPTGPFSRGFRRCDGTKPARRLTGARAPWGSWAEVKGPRHPTGSRRLLRCWDRTPLLFLSTLVPQALGSVSKKPLEMPPAPPAPPHGAAAAAAAALTPPQLRPPLPPCPARLRFLRTALLATKTKTRFYWQCSRAAGPCRGARSQR